MLWIFVCSILPSFYGLLGWIVHTVILKAGFIDDLVPQVGDCKDWNFYHPFLHRLSPFVLLNELLSFDFMYTDCLVNYRF